MLGEGCRSKEVIESLLAPSVGIAGLLSCSTEVKDGLKAIGGLLVTEEIVESALPPGFSLSCLLRYVIKFSLLFRDS